MTAFKLPLAAVLAVLWLSVAEASWLQQVRVEVCRQWPVSTSPVNIWSDSIPRKVDMMYGAAPQTSAKSVQQHRHHGAAANLGWSLPSSLVLADEHAEPASA